MKKLVTLCLVLALVLSVAGCADRAALPSESPASEEMSDVAESSMPVPEDTVDVLRECTIEPVFVPEDFSFALTWNCYGVSSYNSRTGKLIKTTDATNPADYVAEYQLTEEDREYIYSLIESLDIDSYPDVFDPQNGISKPSMTLILTVFRCGEEKTVRAENIALSFVSPDEKGQRFLSVCEAICDRLTATDEWNALPEYEHLYA